MIYCSIPNTMQNVEPKAPKRDYESFPHWVYRTEGLLNPSWLSRGRTETKQKHPFGVFKDKRKHLYMLFTRNFDCVGSKKLILATHNWFLGLSLWKSVTIASCRIFRHCPWSICGLAEFKSSWFFQWGCA